jgi:hypothetical protein
MEKLTTAVVLRHIPDLCAQVIAAQGSPLADMLCDNARDNSKVVFTYGVQQKGAVTALALARVMSATKGPLVIVSDIVTQSEKADIEAIATDKTLLTQPNSEPLITTLYGQKILPKALATKPLRQNPLTPFPLKGEGR